VGASVPSSGSLGVQYRRPLVTSNFREFHFFYASFGE
jgi:hypothetical protein